MTMETGRQTADCLTMCFLFFQKYIHTQNIEVRQRQKSGLKTVGNTERHENWGRRADSVPADKTDNGWQFTVK